MKRNPFGGCALISLCLLLAVPVAAFGPRVKKAAVTPLVQPQKPVLSKSLATWNGVPDTVNVLGVMVEFQKDAYGDNTTGLGLFDSDNGPDYDLDPKKHDKVYFERHLEYARNYFRRVSNGRLVIRYAVVQQSYETFNNITVPYQMKHYRVPKKRDKESFDEFNFRLNQGIMAFAGDALKAIAKAGVLDETQAYTNSLHTDETVFVRRQDKTLILVFHAGASGLTDGGGMGGLFADTPSDLIDSYIWPTDFHDYNGTSYDDDLSATTLSFDYDSASHDYGVYTGDRKNFITQLLMCSETMNQDKLNFGINGIIVNQIARAMGLPDLWDTQKGVSAVGAFCLMDVGGYNTVRGFIPVMPSAWCRVQRGWVDPVVAVPNDSFEWQTTLPSTLVPGDPRTIIKVPMSATEYFLIENRQMTLRSDTACTLYTVNKAGTDTNFIYNPYDTVYGSWGTMVFDSLCRDTPNCTQLYLNPAKAKGVILDASSYDFGLPGFGALIWHIDNQVIKEKLALDGVNDYINRRGVDLEEADGIEDLGAEFVDILGQQTQSYGGPEDFFPHVEVGRHRYITQLAPFNYVTDSGNTDRYFSTHTNTGGYTGITINIDTFYNATKVVEYYNEWGERVRSFAADSFRIKINWMLGQGDWPQLIDSASSPRHLVSVDSLICALSDSGILYILNRDGKRVRTDSSLFAAGFRNPSSPSLMGKAVVFATRDTGGVGGKRLLLHRYDVYAYRDSVLATVDSVSSMTTPVSILGDTLFFGTDSGTLIKASAGNVRKLVLYAGHPVWAVAADSQRVFAVCGNRLFKIDRRTFGTAPAYDVLPMDGLSRICMAAGDIAQKYPGIEIVANDASGTTVLLDSSLNVLPGWPVQLSGGAAVSPALGDVDGDGQMDIVIPGNNMVHALSWSGVPLSGWPHTIAKRESVGPCTDPASLSDIDGDGAQEVFVPTPDGNIIILDNNGQYFEFTAGAGMMHRALSYGGDPGLSCVVKNIDTDAKPGVPEHIEIFTLNRQGSVSCFNVPMSGLVEKSAWQTEGGSLARTYFYAGPALSFRENSGALSVDTLFTFPNPSRVSAFTARYRLSGSADKVRLKLYNSAGDRLMEKEGLPGNALWNQFAVSVRNMAPGMYSLKIEAEKNGKSAVKFTKVGIIK